MTSGLETDADAATRLARADGNPGLLESEKLTRFVVVRKTTERGITSSDQRR